MDHKHIIIKVVGTAADTTGRYSYDWDEIKYLNSLGIIPEVKNSAQTIIYRDVISLC